jgi:DNA replication protein DnaC
MGFEEFWREYPRKVGRMKAVKLWSKLSVEEKFSAMKGLKLWKQTVQWQGNSGMFIPYGSTFLAQRRWEDEPWTGAFEESPAENKYSVVRG